MDWLIKLLEPGNTALASTILLYSVVIFVGIWLGKIKMFGVSLGVTFVLFVGLLLGHIGYRVDDNVLHFLREFGLILFIFSIGMQVGPGFFSSFKEGGIQMNALALLGITLNVVIMLGIYFIQGGSEGSTSISQLVGIMSGAVTNTPGLGAAQQTFLQIVPDGNAVSQEMSMGYAAAYPLGVIGIILTMLLLKAFFHINLEKETASIDAESNSDELTPAMVTFKVTNELVSGLTMFKLHNLISADYVMSRIEKPDGTIIIPTSKTEIHLDDVCLVVCKKQDSEIFNRFLGPEIEKKWEMDRGPVVSRRILVTRTEYNGTKLGSLHLHDAYQLNVTRVNRAGIDLMATSRTHTADGRPSDGSGQTRRHPPSGREARQLDETPQRA